MKKNVLILTEAMMPFCSDWGSCQRIYFYASKLISEGFNVHVICRNNSENPAGTIEIKSIKVTTPDPAKIKEEGSKSLKTKLIQMCKNNVLVHSTLKKIYRFLYSEPNVFRGRESKHWAQKQKQFIKNYIQRENINYVIISGPPFGLFYIAKDIKQLGISLVLDYRDPWNLWYEKFSLSEKYEKRAIESADLVIASTKNLSVALSKKYQKDYIYPILNGYDISAWHEQDKEITTPTDKLVISYVGYIMVNNSPAFRDPGCFIETACDFLKDKDDIEIRFIGVADVLSSIKDEYKEKIIFKNRVSVEEALREVRASNAVIVIHTAKDSSGKYIVCGKLYDYLKSGKFVLSIGNKAICNNDLIERYDAGISCDNNVKSIRESLELIYMKWQKNELKVDVPKDIIKYSRECQNTEFVRLMNNLNKQGVNEND